MTARQLLYVLVPLGLWGDLSAQNTQLDVRSGTYLTLAPGCGLSLRNTDVHVEGILDGPESQLFFYGGADQAIYSFMPVGVRELRLKKQAGSRVILHADVQASNLVDFGGGDLELNGYDLTVAGVGLQNENDGSRITALSGGSVIARLTGVNAPKALNPGQLGAIISSPANLGNLTIQRLQKPYLFNQSSGIQRSYLIEPQTNSGLKASFRFNYLDADLNGENPATLMLWKSDDGIVWTNYTPDSLSSVGELQFAEKSGIDSFSYWTLADAANPLATVLSSFSAVCQNDYALITWHTASEVQVDHFEVERSLDGISWTYLQTFVATNSPAGSGYSFQDHSPQSADFYRLKIVNRSGTVQYSPAFSGGCADLAFPLTVYPNPVVQDVTLRLGLRAAAEGQLQLMNAGGEVVSVRNWSLTTGINQISLSLSGLAPGLYVARLVTNQGSYQIRLMKK